MIFLIYFKILSIFTILWYLQEYIRLWKNYIDQRLLKLK